MLSKSQLDRVKQLIPGFDFLSDAQQLQFLETNTGLTVIHAVHLIENYIKSRHFWSRFIGDTIQEFIANERRVLHHSIRDNIEYIQLKEQIIYCILAIYFNDILLLTTNEAKSLMHAECSHQLYPDIPMIVANRKILQEEFNNLDFWAKSNFAGRKIKHQLSELNTNLQFLIEKWYQTCCSSALDARQINVILAHRKQMRLLTKAKYPEQVYNLAEFFPILYYPVTPNQLSPIDKFRHDYPALHYVNFSEMTTRLLTATFAQYLDITFGNNINYANLQRFNFNQAQQIADKAILNYNENLWFNLQRLFENYADELKIHVYNQLLVDNQMPWFFHAHNNSHIMLSSLSYMLLNSHYLNKTMEFCTMLSNAHAFVQITGISNQNYNPLFSILELYNYARIVPAMARWTNILNGISNVLKPLYAEFILISDYEPKASNKIIRSLIPIMIFFGFCVGALTLLSLMGLPEIALIIMLVPIAFLGIGVTSLYVYCKDNIYKKIRELYYGGCYSMPEFNVNERIIAICGSLNIAADIREFYITSLEKCDRIESQYSQTASQGSLRANELNNRQKNLQYRHLLCIEWYDIHSNYALGIDDARKIIETQLQKYVHKKHCSLQKSIREETPQVNLSIDSSICALIKTLTNKISPFCLPIDTICESIIDPTHPNLLFTPGRSLKKRNQILDINATITGLRQ